MKTLTASDLTVFLRSKEFLTDTMESASIDEGVVSMKRGSVDITLDRLSMCSVKTIDEEVRIMKTFLNPDQIKHK